MWVLKETLRSARKKRQKNTPLMVSKDTEEAYRLCKKYLGFEVLSI